MLFHGFHQWPQSTYRARVTATNAYTASRVARVSRDPRIQPLAGSTPSTILGSATHTAILEPEFFADRHPVAPDVDRRTKAGKEEWSAFMATVRPDCEPVTMDQRDAALRARDAVMANPDARALVTAQGMREGSALTRVQLADFDGGEPLRVAAGARPDLLTVDADLVQIKTGWKGYDPRQFAYTLRDLRYLEGEAWCGFVTALAGAIVVQRVCFVVVEVSLDGPVRCRVYTAQASSSVMAAAFSRAVAAIRRDVEYQLDPESVTRTIDATVAIDGWEV